MKQSITELTPQFFANMGVGVVLLDVDNTLARHGVHQPAEGAVRWARDMVEAGLQLVIVSNNYKKRVESFAAQFGLEWISFALKPLPFGYLKAKRRFGVPSRECAIVGDQIFTDIVGANLCGMKSVLLQPLELETSFSFRLRRRAEARLRRSYESRKDVMKK